MDGREGRMKRRNSLRSFSLHVVADDDDVDDGGGGGGGRIQKDTYKEEKHLPLFVSRMIN